MLENFPAFARAFRTHFDKLAKGELFVLDTRRNDVWEWYLNSFPEGTNPVFRTNSEHDCSCCRHFIRDVGNLVTIKDGEITTVWDIPGLPYPYDVVAAKVAEFVRTFPIRGIFLMPHAEHGREKDIVLIDEKTHRFDHFAVKAPAKFVDRDYVAKRGEVLTTFGVFERGLTELTRAALETVIELCKSNLLYRGAEFLRSVEAFAELRERVAGINDPDKRKRAIWEMIREPIARFRNTAIGTLVTDLSEGMEQEAAVRLYQAKVNPLNYRRTTAPISKNQVESALEKIAELGLEDALERRHARFSDVSINSVLFVDNAVQGEMKGGLKGLLMEEVKPVKFDVKKAEEISIDAFVANILPQAKSIQLYLQNEHFGNFASLTAPVHPNSGKLFRWGNDFAWSYDGNITDSIKERVKKAGGQVENIALRVSLAWYNTDDLDLHAYEPNGNHVYFGNKFGLSRSHNNGVLDVDMNVHHYVRDAVENIRWAKQPAAGLYKINVNQFTRRETRDVGFELEIEFGGKVHSYRYVSAVSGTIKAAEIVVDKAGNITVNPGPEMTVATGPGERVKWGLKSQALHRVNSVVLSPNFWDDRPVGNKHWFFLLDKCLNPLPTRGIYNEFLSQELMPHSKVLEVLGEKTKCPVTDEQLSGLGFSSTLQNKVSVVVTGPNMVKSYTIVFGG